MRLKNLSYICQTKQRDMEEILEELKLRLAQSKLNNYFYSDAEVRWQDGFERGLEEAIEAVEEIISKHNENNTL